MTFDTLEEYHQLPTINKQIMMDNFTTLNTCGLDKDDVVAYAVEKEMNKDYYGYYQDEYVVGLSSGTSGNKGIYITPKALTKRLPFVFLARSGLKLRHLPFRILFLLRVFSQGFDDINAPFVKLNYLSTMEDPAMIIDTINMKRINIIMAPPSLLRQLLPLADKVTVQIKQIVSYAEVLPKEEKQKLQDAFHTEVIELYQASEGQMASACKHGHLHINEDMVYVELYDRLGKLITEDNVVGQKMIITNLVNKAQPLIRYEMNDMVVLDSTCSCGSQFRRIKQVLGRHDDLLYFMTKSKKERIVYPDLFVRWIIVVSDKIREFQVVQYSFDRLELRLDIREDNENIIKALASKLLQELKSLGIFDVTIDIVVGPLSLPEDKNKFKRFISKLNHT
jgi:putative adenylate-forming enzyme